jgi:hypothetical protein
MEENNGRAVNPPVIVRAWGDEPVKLFLYAVENNRCKVGKEGATKTIGLPFDQVFYFDLDIFTSLSTAFAQSDKRDLASLWQKMTVDDFACNRYQDKLKCSHDQEHFANSERAPSSNDE